MRPRRRRSALVGRVDGASTLAPRRAAARRVAHARALASRACTARLTRRASGVAAGGRGARPRRARARRRGRRRSARRGRRARCRAWPRRPSRAPRRARPVSASTCAAITEVAKCRDGMAARGLPPRKPYSGAQPDFQNCSPYSTIIRRSSGVRPSSIRPCARGVPGRGGRDRPVAEQPEVERRVDVRGARAGSCSGWRRSRYGDRAVREQRTRPSATTRAPSPRRWKLPGVPSARCSRSVGVVPTADDAGRPAPGRRPCTRRSSASGSSLGISYVGQVGPHLQHARADVARARARDQDARARTGRAAAAPGTTGGGSFSRRRTSGAATPAASAVTRGRADGGRAAHGAASLARGVGRAAYGWPYRDAVATDRCQARSIRLHRRPRLCAPPAAGGDTVDRVDRHERRRRRAVVDDRRAGRRRRRSSTPPRTSPSAGGWTTSCA